MFEHIATFTAYPILTGIMVGFVAAKLSSGESKGCLVNLIIGIIGSYVGTFLCTFAGIEPATYGFVGNFVICLVGAIVFLWLLRKIF